MENIDRIDRIPKENRPLQVCAYARVSADSFMMLNSLSSQILNYATYIKSHEDWIYRGVYKDYAKIGTKEDRPGFLKMMEEARLGHIDMVITKSISRFARNTLTVLESTRELKSLGVDVYFEEQDIHSLSSDGEMLLSIMASYYQEESRSISENIRWRNRKDMEEGKLVGSNNMYGYRLEKRTYVVKEDEAEVVRRIFELYKSGLGAYRIAKKLNDEGIKTLKGKPWRFSTIMQMINNVNYTGTLILQKTYREDYLSKRKRINRGEKPMYVVENNHEAIIGKDLFEECQRMKKDRLKGREGK